MRKYITAYYLLFVLVVMGAFAAMAFNDYGTKLMGIACLGFTFAFIHEAIFNTPTREDLTKREKIFISLELISIAFISLVFFARNFVLGITGTNEVLLLSSIALLLLAIRQAWIHLRLTFARDWKLGVTLLFYFGMVVLFIASFNFGMIQQGRRMVFATLAIIALVAFVLLSFIFRHLVVDGENVSPWRYAMRMKNKLVILVFTSVLIYGYIFLSSINMLPALYYGRLPSRFLRPTEKNVKNEAEEKQKEWEFIDQYQQFVKRHSGGVK